MPKPGGRCSGSQADGWATHGRDCTQGAGLLPPRDQSLPIYGLSLLTHCVYVVPLPQSFSVSVSTVRSWTVKVQV